MTSIRSGLRKALATVALLAAVPAFCASSLPDVDPQERSLMPELALTAGAEAARRAGVEARSVPAIPYTDGYVTIISREGEQCYENYPGSAWDMIDRYFPGMFEQYPAATTCASLGMPVFAGNLASGPSVRVYTTSTSMAQSLCSTGLLVNCSNPSSGGSTYTDLWWNPAESGWGLSVTHHATGIAFLAWYVYDAVGNPKWYVAPACRISAGSCTDTLYETQGPPFPGAFDPSAVVRRAVGTITLRFASASSGSISYTLNGVSGTKTITRQSF